MSPATRPAPERNMPAVVPARNDAPAALDCEGEGELDVELVLLALEDDGVPLLEPDAAGAAVDEEPEAAEVADALPALTDAIASCWNCWKVF